MNISEQTMTMQAQRMRGKMVDTLKIHFSEDFCG